MAEDRVFGSERKAFCFRLEGSDEVWAMPLLNSLPMDEVMGFGPQTTLGEFMAVFERYCPGLGKHISFGDFKELLVAWQEASGITVGESLASSD